MKNKQIKVSIVVPVYNEVKRLEKLYEIYDFIKRKNYLSEIIVVNDGSTIATTAKKLKKISQDLDIRVISYKKNKGKGFAVKTGMQEAKGDVHFFTDLDLSVDINYIDQFLKQTVRFPIVVGSRRKRNSKIVIHQSSIRESMGKVFTGMSRIALRLSVSDFTCGFKCFNKESSRRIFNKLTVNGWGFDSEILFLGKKFGYSIKEFPVEWKNDRESKVKFPGAVFSSFYELIKIRSNQIRGFYDQPKD